MSTARLSLVIPTRDRPRALAACLAAVAESFPAQAETVVVDDGGAADLAPVVAPYLGTLALRLVRVEHGGPAWARNRGLDAATGGVVAFTDDDCRPQPGWLPALAAGVAADPPRAVGGSTHNGLPGNAYADAAQLVLELLSVHDRAKSGQERLLASNNIAFPAAPLRRLGGFDESFRTAEDRELCRRWRRAGFTLGRVPGAVVHHDAQLDLRRFVGQFVAYGRGAARFHAGGAGRSLRESIGFHLRLPAMALPGLARRGVRRGLAVGFLLALWELTNLAGYLAEASRRSRRVGVTGPAIGQGAQ